MSLVSPAAYTTTSDVDVYVLPVGGNDHLRPLSGGVEVDSSAAVRRRLSASFAVYDESFLPSSPNSPFAPGKELQPFRSSTWLGGSASAPLGVFRIVTAQVDDSGAKWTISIEGRDRSYSVARTGYSGPYSIALGTNYGLAIRDLLLSCYPAVQFASSAFATNPSSITTLTTPAITFGLETDADPWSDLRELAAAIGKTALFDTNGRFDLQGSSTRRWEYKDGEGSPLLEGSTSLSHENTYSHVIMTGEADNGAPVRGEAIDTTPGSPTNIATFGDIRYKAHSPLLKTDDQCALAAFTILQRVKGAQEQLELTTMVNPELETGEQLHVQRRDLDAFYIVDSFGLPFDIKGTQAPKVRRIA